MYRSTQHRHNLSLRLSEVLGDIGVNECKVTRWRREGMLTEKMGNLYSKLVLGIFASPCFKFGSRTEGSTTPGLHSDLDMLLLYPGIEVVQVRGKWQLGKLQYLMVRNESTSPGYCLLQLVRSEMPLPLAGIQMEHHLMDNEGNLFLKHSLCLQHEGDFRHGPAMSVHATDSMNAEDRVVALHCRSWPSEAESWLHLHNKDGWPTEPIKHYAVTNGCFLAPVSSKTSELLETEWRISTSYAERLLMYSLNITQLRCFVLMKMMIKTYVDPKVKNCITSFMCKTVLFHTVYQSTAVEWMEATIISCLIMCLQVLRESVRDGNLPHFIIPGNNLLAGKLTADMKQELTEIMRVLIENTEQSLVGISVDNLGERLSSEHRGLSGNGQLVLFEDQVDYLTKRALFVVHSNMALFYHFCLNLRSKESKSAVENLKSKLTEMYSVALVGDYYDQIVYNILAPFVCSLLGSVFASMDIHSCSPLSPESLMCFCLGMNSDVSSGKLKLASALLCAGNFDKSETILNSLKRHLDRDEFINFCPCNMTFPAGNSALPERFVKLFYEMSELQLLKYHAVYCVTFQLSERYCVPLELQYEMFTHGDLPQPKRIKHKNRALVDSLSYLYFLQYKIYSQLNRPADQQVALGNLIRTINTGPALSHPEVALNLLGQCMEQESQHQEALTCYVRSLKKKPRDNAAVWLICLILFRALLVN